MRKDIQPLSEPGQEQLEGSVERVTFHSEETGFCVLRVKARGQRAETTVIGHLPQVVAGEWIQAAGAWIVNREHGRQFQAAALKTLPPDSLEGITKFLGSGLIKGIGPIYASRLVEHFGAGIFDVIDKESARLETVEGIGRVRRQLIKESWQQTRQIRAIMSFLMANGVSTARAFRIYKAYGDEAIQKVRADPYCLARDIHGVGFLTADQIAAKLGIEKTSDLRARAGVEHVLLESTQEGHCALPRATLASKAAEILEIPDDIIQRAVAHGMETGRLVAEEDPQLHDTLIYPAPLHDAEVQLAKRLRQLAAGQHPCPPIAVAAAIGWAEQKIGLTLAPAQQDAVKMALESKVLVLTGGPGVGKTTLINALLRILDAKKLRTVLCAPTGRAAKRMAETTAHEAKTIHRLLAFDPREGGFKQNENNPLAGDVFIVDETSMLDLPLAWNLIRAIPTRAAVILVGDADQLPSVGPGSVLRDIIASQAFPVCRLTHIFRQAAQSDIVANAHRINEGLMPEVKPEGEKSDFYFIEQEDADKAADLIVRLASSILPKKMGFNARDDIQVLAPMRRGALGSQTLNQRLQDAINPGQEQVERFGIVYRNGDKVMQLENDYDKDVFNGDLGTVRKIDEANRELTVFFDGRPVIYDLQELDELAPAYAITIHKSQGSEYPCVIIPLHTQHYMMLQRNLLYTAITRGKRCVVLVGTKKAVSIAVHRQDSRRRITTLRRRLNPNARFATEDA